MISYKYVELFFASLRQGSTIVMSQLMLGGKSIALATVAFFNARIAKKKQHICEIFVSKSYKNQ